MKSSQIAYNSVLLITVWLTAAVSVWAQPKPFTVRFAAERHYLQLPVKNGAPKRLVELYAGDDKWRWFSIELAEGEADWYAYLDISPYRGTELELRVDALDAGSQTFSTVVQTDSMEQTRAVYREPLRGQFHFSPRHGWNNDPNGLAYYNGEYHLFFQHNPYGTGWGNMHWGHAVSTDLVHWKELGIALYPDTLGTMFSGGAVVDSINSSGLGSRPPLVLFYTAAERSWTQGLAYTADGRTFHKLGMPILEKITDGNRDPKVIWHEPTKRWVMVLYVTEPEEQHAMHFFTSADLKSWTFASKVLGGKGNDRYLFECPEFFELPVSGDPGVKKWVLTGANSQYAIGTFDGQRFIPEDERLFSQHGRDYYAAQTFSNEPLGRRIEIGWWRTHTVGGNGSFNQSMSIPMELSLRQTESGIRLFRSPVDELRKLRKSSQLIRDVELTPGGTDPLGGLDAELAELRLTIDPQTARNIQLDIRGLIVNYHVAEQELVIDGVRSHAPLVNGKQELILYVDRTGVEVFASGGQVFMPINYNVPTANTRFGIRVSGGDARIEQLEIHELTGIFPDFSLF